MKKKIYAIVDLETTGALSERDRITEIAIALHDGEKVIETFTSLVNPERAIPYNITQITGISQEMVDEAPKFYEVAKKVVEMTEGAVFVATMCASIIISSGPNSNAWVIPIPRKQLCTVRLSRQSFPWIGSYSLGNLIRYFNIEVSGRHRAMADVMATVNIFERILDMEEQEEAINQLINRGVRESPFASQYFAAKTARPARRMRGLLFPQQIRGSGVRWQEHQHQKSGNATFCRPEPERAKDRRQCGRYQL